MTSTDTHPIVTDLRAIADFLEHNPDLAEHVSLHNAMAYVGGEPNPKALLARFIRAGKAAGAEIRKDYGDQYAGAYLDFGPRVALNVYGTREQVCERVVTGTREVTREVPDPDALTAVPTVTVTETVEDVTWECAPLLAESAVAG